MMVMMALLALKSDVSNGLAACRRVWLSCRMVSISKRMKTKNGKRKQRTLLTRRMGEKTIAKLLGLIKLLSLCCAT